MLKQRRADRRLPAPEDLDKVVDRFELAWQGGTPPAIEEFLPAVPSGKNSADNPLRRELVQELVKIDLEYRWRRPTQEAASSDAAGPPSSDASFSARPRLEDYVERL